MANSSLFIRFLHWFARESNIQFSLYFFSYVNYIFQVFSYFLVSFLLCMFCCCCCCCCCCYYLSYFFGFVDPAFSEYPVPYPCSYYLAPIVICSHLQTPQEDLKSTHISQCISGFICVIYQSSLIHTI